MSGPQTLDDCKISCSKDDLKWQWVSFENNTCYCIELLEHGEFNIRSLQIIFQKINNCHLLSLVDLKKLSGGIRLLKNKSDSVFQGKMAPLRP